MKIIFLTIGLLFFSGHFWAQRSAEIISYSGEPRPDQELYEVKFLINNADKSDVLQGIDEFQPNHNSNYSTHWNGKELTIFGPYEVQSIRYYGPILLQLGIDTIVSRQEEVVTESPIESYLNKINNR